jgi:hypothetical protein
MNLSVHFHKYSYYTKVFLRSMCRLLVTANVPSLPILITLMMGRNVLRNVRSYKSHTA